MAISSSTSRTRTFVSLTAICWLVLPTAALAETEATVNGTEIDSTVVDFYLESALQKPAAQATAEERIAVIRDLTDIYLLTTQPAALQLAASDRFKAQIELQNRGALAQAVAQEFLASNQASDEEILEEFERQIAAAPPLQFKARHILVENQAAAIELITQLDNGSDFEELAKEHSTGPSGPSGGDLPWRAVQATREVRGQRLTFASRTRSEHTVRT